MTNTELNWTLIDSNEFLDEYISEDGKWIKQVWWDGEETFHPVAQ